MDQAFVMDVCKLVIAAAWCDGDLAAAEINTLKNLIYSVAEVDEASWQVLEMYMDAPVKAAEREVLLQRVVSGVTSQSEKQFVLQLLYDLIQMDGQITPAEAAFYTDLKQALDQADTGLLGLLKKGVHLCFGRSQQAGESILRENDRTAYFENPVYYELLREQKEEGVTVHLPADPLQKLCLVVGLLAYIAHVDETISRAERTRMDEIISAKWEITADEADLLVRLACRRNVRGVDLYQMARNLAHCTTREERIELAELLFSVANAETKTDLGEIEEIRLICRLLKLDHQEFIDAKLTVKRADRKGF